MLKNVAHRHPQTSLATALPACHSHLPSSQPEGTFVNPVPQELPRWHEPRRHRFRRSSHSSQAQHRYQFRNADDQWGYRSVVGLLVFPQQRPQIPQTSKTAAVRRRPFSCGWQFAAVRQAGDWDPESCAQPCRSTDTSRSRPRRKIPFTKSRSIHRGRLLTWTVLTFHKGTVTCRIRPGAGLYATYPAVTLSTTDPTRRRNESTEHQLILSTKTRLMTGLFGSLVDGSLPEGTGDRGIRAQARIRFLINAS